MKVVDSILKHLKKYGWASVVSQRIWLHENYSKYKCEKCGKMPKYIVYEAEADVWLCLDCTINAFERELEGLKLLREKLEVTKK